MFNKNFIKNQYIDFVRKNFFIILAVLVWIYFASPYLFFGRTPYPSTYQVNNFPPASVYPGMGGPVKNNAQPDIITQIYPWRHFSIQEIKKGSLPLWNPYSFGGTPHLANYQSAVLFPLNLLFLLPLKFIDVWGLLVVVQPLLAALFMYILMRSFKVSKSASFVSSVSFMFCGFLVTWLGYATLGYAILVLPLALFAINKYLLIGKVRYLLLLAITFPFSFFAGHFQTSIYFLIIVAAYALFKFFSSNQRKESLSVFFFIFIGILLTMPQVLPSLEFYSLSFRSSLFLKIEAIPINYLITFFSPDFFGNPVTRNDWYGHYAEWNGYAGVIPLMLAIYIILFYRTKKTIFFILSAIFALIFSIDTPLLDQIVKLKIPVISTSAASRMIVIFSFSIAVLSGYGFDSLIRDIKNRQRIIKWIAVSVAILFILMISAYFLNDRLSDKANLSIALKNSILPLSIILLTSICSLILSFKKSKTIILLVSSFLLFLLIFDMIRFAKKWQNFDPKNLVYPEVKITEFYNNQNDYDRFVGLSGGEDAVYYEIPILSGYDPLYISDYGKFLRFVERGLNINPERSVVTFPLKGIFTADTLNFMGVKYIVHKVSDGTFPWAFPFKDYPISQFTKIYDDTNYQVFKNNASYERAFIINEVKKTAKESMLEQMFSSDLKKVAFIEEDTYKFSKNGSGSAKIVEYKANAVKIAVKSNEESMLVLTDNYYPGWKAKVNGKQSKIYKTNYTFRGIIIPQGESYVELSYFPTSFSVGIYLFLCGILAIVTFWVLRYIKVFKWNL